MTCRATQSANSDALTPSPVCCCTAQVKNSGTRNLHRLAAAILFVKLLFEKLVSQAAAAAAGADSGADADAAAAQAPALQHQVSLREAASHAYEAALAPLHTSIVKVRKNVVQLLLQAASCNVE